MESDLEINNLAGVSGIKPTKNKYCTFLKVMQSQMWTWDIIIVFRQMTQECWILLPFWPQKQSRFTKGLKKTALMMDWTNARLLSFIVIFSLGCFLKWCNNWAVSQILWLCLTRPFGRVRRQWEAFWKAKAIFTNYGVTIIDHLSMTRLGDSLLSSPLMIHWKSLCSAAFSTTLTKAVPQ